MTIGHPQATIVLSGAPGSGLGLDEGAVRRLRVDLSVDELHDRVELWLWPGSKLAAAKPGDTVGVALGLSHDNSDDVLTAEVSGISLMPGGVLLSAYCASRRLSSAYVGRAWKATTLGQVVQDLLGDGGVAPGDIDASLSFPALHIDPRRCVWSVLHDLARRTGHQVTSTSDGKVSFGPAPGISVSGSLGGLVAAAGAVGDAAGSALGLGGSSDELREGAHLVAFAAANWSAQKALPRVSPSSAQSWFLLDSAPDDGSSVQVVDPTLRSREAADAATKAAEAAVSRARQRARVRTPGRPGFRAGDLVTARGTDYRILQASHLVDANQGYVCDLLLEGAA
jgi:hypothetical protein